MDRWEVEERHNALLPPYNVNFFTDGLAVHMFQYGNYVLKPPVHATV